MRLLNWWLGRAVTAVITLIGVSVLIFAAVRMMPGGFAQTILGPFATAQQKAELAARYGLDESIFVQYGRWLAAVGHGDFGTSMISQQPVGAELLARLPVTGQLTLFAVVLAVLVGVPLGVWTAVRAKPGGAVLGRLASGLGVSVPEFVLGSLVVFVFSRFALGIPVGGYSGVRSMILPSIVLSLFAISVTARTTRDAVLNVLVEPYVTAAVARGESPWFVIRHHVLRNAAIPVVTLVATIVAYLLGGALVVEYVFNLPGIGSYVVQAVGRRDYAVVQAGVLLAAIVFVLLNAIVDLFVGVIDPRIGRRA